MPSGLDGNPNPITSSQRGEVLTEIVKLIQRRQISGTSMLVGIDGIDGSGKSTFADELATRLAGDDASVVRSTIDSFHNPQQTRWQRGKQSPVGFYLDSHNLDALQEQLLQPFRSGPGAIYRTEVFDEPSDQPIDVPARRVTGDEILVFDGIFLQRPELADYWDVTIFLDGQARVDLGRLGYVMADAPGGGPDLAGHILTWVKRLERYTAGMRLYLDSDRPTERADVLIDNNDLSRPVIIRRPAD